MGTKIPDLPGGSRTGLLADDLIVIDNGSATNSASLEQVSNQYLKNVSMGCRISSDTAQTLSDITLTQVSFDTVDFGVGSVDDVSSNRLAWTTGEQGLYILNALVIFDTSTTNTLHRLVLRLNGTGNTFQAGSYSDSSGDYAISVSGVWDIQISDTFEAWAYQNSGGNMDIVYKELSCLRIAQPY